MALIGTLTSSVSALSNFTEGLEVIGNNIANVNTTGYKSSSASYSDSFSNTLRAATSVDSSRQTGTGVQLAGISTNYTQGSISTTGVSTDLAISGEGYFIVQDPNSGAQYITRDGSFKFDDNGYLVNASGLRVLDSASVPIQIPTTGVQSKSISSNGAVSYVDTAGVTHTVATVGLAQVADQAKLMKEGGNLYDYSATTVAIGIPGANGTGVFKTYSLELSNVDLTAELTNMITMQRSFQANARIVTVSDTILDDIVNMKRS
ncbi:flagellar hook-basal body complex protein [Opitutaceae bacterium TAV4]|nr:flagellar hook-basal body complex protein [Opitutaceae bacterium TAV4]RRK02614.1 flagellar hook-basal body complex protein [Opitutaceae bacterium TAV3]